MSRLPELEKFTLIGPVYAHRLPSGAWRVLHGDERATAVFLPDGDFQRHYKPYSADTGPSRSLVDAMTEPATELAAAIATVMKPEPEGRTFPIRLQSVTIQIPTTPSQAVRPNANSGHSKGAGIAYGKEKKRLREVARLAAVSYLNTVPPPRPVFPDNSRLHVQVAWEKVRSGRYPNGRYRTPVDGHDALPLMCKGAIDGLVDAGLLEDDRHITVEYVQVKDATGEGMTTITLTMPEVQP